MAIDLNDLDVDLSIEDFGSEDLDYIVTAFKCAGSFSTASSFGCGTLASGSSFSSAGG